MGLFLAQGANDPLSITIRYTWLVVPGFALGALFWWERRADPSPGPRVRLAWGTALTLSLLLTVTSNPHRSLSMVMPDSISPWVHASPVTQWLHGVEARQALKVIPATASVAANTPLVPLLAQRQAIVRFPYDTKYLDQNRKAQSVEWVAVDLSLLERYGVAFRRDWRQLKKSLVWIEENRQTYTPQAIRDGWSSATPGRTIHRHRTRNNPATPLPHPLRGTKRSKTMPRSESNGGSRRVRSGAEPIDQSEDGASAGVLRDQQTLHEELELWTPPPGWIDDRR